MPPLLGNPFPSEFWNAVWTVIKLLFSSSLPM